MLLMITERQQKLLERVIREYVQTAEPVSSKSLEESRFLGVSSATIRSEMNELERSGYLEQPHTSAGRVPTDKAYRFFVDKIVKQDPINITTQEKKKITETINETSREPREINKSIAQVLSELTDQLVITNVLNGEDFYKVGLKSLFELPEFREFERMFQLTSFFEEFDAIFGQIELGFSPSGDKVRIFIGHESPFRDLINETVICAEYRLPHNHTGSITLVGPTRMNYRRNIGLVRFAADELNELYG
jgi:heat-inducible transcriptional repressor